MDKHKTNNQDIAMGLENVLVLFSTIQNNFDFTEQRLNILQDIKAL